MPRYICNLYKHENAVQLTTPQTLANATTATMSDGFRSVDTTENAFRVIWQLSFRQTCVAGRRYAVRVQARNLSAAVGDVMIAPVAGTGSFTSVGSWQNNSAGANAVLGAVFDCTSSGTLAIRFGVGCNAAVNGHPFHAEFGNPLMSEIPKSQAVPPEFIPPGTSCVCNSACGVTNVGGFVVDGVGSQVFYDDTESIIVVGDSLSNDMFDWPNVLESKQIGVHVNAIAGRTMLQATSDVVTQITLNGLQLSESKTLSALGAYVVRPKSAVVAVGINDVFGDASLATMQSRLQSMISTLNGLGVKNNNIVVFNLPPFKTYTLYTAGRGAVHAAYNAWVPTFCATNGIVFFDLYAVLNDTGNDGALLAAYDYGDHLHPNATGGLAIASAIEPILRFGRSYWAPFDSTLPALALSPDCPGKLKQVQEWEKVASAREIERY